MTEEKISRYDRGTYSMVIPKPITEIIPAIKALEKFKLLVISSQEFTLRTYCQAIEAFYHKRYKNKLSMNRWLTFVDYIVENRFHVSIEHIKGADNFLADKLSGMIQETFYRQ